MKLSNEELEHLGKLSGLSLTKEEKRDFLNQLQEVLSYTDELSNLDLGAEVEANRGVNVFRDDKAHRYPSKEILEIMPVTKGSHIVVPKTLD